jgi:AcrR family transcriptional regulator
MAAVDARSSILRSAIVTFARKGYAGTGVQEILDAVHLSKPTLYYYFRSKAGLYKAILDHAFEEYFRIIEQAIEAKSDCEEKLVSAAAALFEFTVQNQDLSRLVFAAVFAAPDEAPPNLIDPGRSRRIFELMIKQFEGAQAAGEIDPSLDALDLAHGFFGAISHRNRSYLLTRSETLDRNLARRIVSLFLNGARRFDHRPAKKT